MDEKKYLKLNDIEAYKDAFNLSNKVFGIVMSWDYISKDTVGKQFIRATDSISANIAEGFGRYYKKEKIQFYRYSYGSLYESLDWNEKARVRNLLTEDDYKVILKSLQTHPKSINSLIKYTNLKLTN